MKAWTYLNVGCGPFPRHLEGWYNIDSRPRSGETAQIDITDTEAYSKLFQKYSFSRVYFGHILSQVDYAQALQVLEATFHGLQPGGRIRVTDQDYGWFFSTYFSAADFESVKIRQSIVGNKRDLNDVAKNIVFTGPFHQFWYDLHRWGHRSIYDAAEMEGLLRRAGFSGIKQFQQGKSEDVIFNGIEPRLNLPQFCLEADKP